MSVDTLAPELPPARKCPSVAMLNGMLAPKESIQAKGGGRALDAWRLFDAFVFFL